MAPKKSKADGDDKGKKPVAPSSSRVTRSMVRRTRSETRGASSTTSSGSASKQVKLESPKKTKKKKATNEAGSSKRIKKEDEAPVVIKKEKESDEDDAAAENSNEKTIIIEYCKQCSSFKTRANEVKDGLEKAVPGIIISLNPENKPRRGCFEIREKDGEIFISLLNMKRPFTQMKKLDMDKVIQDIVEKIT